MDFARGFAFEAGRLVFFCMDAERRRVRPDDLRRLLAQYPSEISGDSAAVLLTTFSGSGDDCTYYSDYMSACTSAQVDTGAVLAEAQRIVRASPVKMFRYAAGAFHPAPHTDSADAATIGALEEAIACALAQYRRLAAAAAPAPAITSQPAAIETSPFGF